MNVEEDEIKIGNYIATSANNIKKAIGIKLLEENGNRTLSVPVDQRRAFPILNIIEPFDKLMPIDFPPVLPCDFLKSIVDALGNRIVKIVIHDLTGEEYSVRLYLLINGQTGCSVEIDMQDALSLIATTNTPLYVKEHVFTRCDEKKRARINWYDLYEDYAFAVLNQMPLNKIASYPIDELNIFLEKAVEKEEYSLAAKMRNVLAEKQAQ
jgi:bifunctional DNase/RNase